MLLRVLDLAEHRGERSLGDLRVVAQGLQRLPVAFEFLQQIGLQVCAGSDFEDLEQRRQRRVMTVRCCSAK